MPDDPKPPDIEVTKTTTVSSGTQSHCIDRILYLLFAGMLVFAVMLVLVEKFFASDGQIFQVVAGLLTGFSGAFFAKIKGGDGK